MPACKTAQGRFILAFDAMEPALPEHIDETVKAVAQFHAEHGAEATRFQRLLARMRRAIGSAGFVAAIGLAIACWIALNTVLLLEHVEPLDPPPFFWLQGGVGILALYTTILVLATQSREDELARQREQLALQLAILSEQKSAKIIQLLEALRRDHPDIEDRVDHEAGAMSEPTDPHAVLNAIKSNAARERQQKTPVRG
ncbi:MAG: DUF1003 domain-containing protein [Beijerinckiaceae bacterium]|nr:DUF1003 domain-containing protein [Beijerinckiaceae bacterium]